MVEDYIPEGEGDIDDLCMEIPVEIPVVNLEHAANTPSHVPQRCLNKKKLKKNHKKIIQMETPVNLGNVIRLQLR